MSHKTCRRCGISQQLNNYYFRYKGNTGYLDSACKSCSKPPYQKVGCKYDRLTADEIVILLTRSISAREGSHMLGVSLGTFRRYRKQYLQEIVDDEQEYLHRMRVRADTHGQEQSVINEELSILDQEAQAINGAT